MGQYFQQIKTIWERMETPQRVSMVLIAMVFIGLLVFIMVGATRPTWRVLATDLSAARTAEIVSHLQSQNIPHRVADRETTILVPTNQVYALRNEMASLDMLDGESEGFKLLDRGSFGQSTHMEMRTYDRAVAGELERSFRELNGVKGARVIISRPQPSPFVREENEPSISVKLSMAGSRRLSERQLHGVTHLAAAAVEGARPERVQVMDDKGLISRVDEDPNAMRAGNNFELSQAMEKELQQKAQRQLDRLVGPDRGTVSLSLDLDFTKRSQAISRVFDPVVIEERTVTKESETPVPRRGGVAGTQPNVEGVPGGQDGGTPMATESMEDILVKRAGSKENTTVEEQVGRIRGMTVSIVIDQRREQEPILDENGEETGEFEERFIDYTDQQKQMFEQAVLDAIGFAAARGSQLSDNPEANVNDRFSVSLATVQPVTSDSAAAPAALAGFMGTGWEEEQVRRWGSWALAAIVALGLLLVARGQLKKAQRAIEAEAQRRRDEAAAKQRAEEERQRRLASSMGEDDTQQRRDQMRGNLVQQVADDPDAAAQVVRAWLHE